MAAAAAMTIVEVSQVVPVGALDPENVVTPSIYVNRVLDRSGIGVSAGTPTEPARPEAS
jgi:3-oxoadipate CoA-transferase alpha subunit